MVRDTAGQEELSAMRDQYIRSGQGFLLVYSVTSRISFDEIDGLRQRILRVKDEANYFPMVICGNKCDLPDDVKEVTLQMGQDYCDNLGIVHLETSAKEKINVVEAFCQVVRELQKYYNDSNAGTGDDKKKRRSGMPKCSIL
eukprot:TRINITY_DN123_c0_g1_i4.p1 TRINITY_DN123_c0_g1~~TRINITY_DN123_c0_g1_i4.p1  ORF type:complete len:142 (-),score=35.06 TRINITY_DN123_c0_g1_i4:48-473(-)